MTQKNFPHDWKEKLEACTTEAEVRKLVDGFDWAGPIGTRAQEKIASLHRTATRPKPWHRQPATWIALGSLIVSVASLIVSILRH